MEVHHHSHTERKKWTHYVWEFFMLFLAVFAGFLAENQREHFVEHQREKKFIKSFVEDLKTDTSNLSSVIPTMIEKGKLLDELVVSLKSPEVFKRTKEIYQQVSRLWQNASFIPNKGTIQQLKNSGALRLIRSQEASDSIMMYDKLLEVDDLNLSLTIKTIDETFEKCKEIFDFTNLSWIQYVNKNLPTPNTFIFLINDRKQMDILSNQILYQKIAEVNYLQHLEVTKETAKNIIIFLKREYRLN